MESGLTLLRNADVYAPAHVGRCDVLIGGGIILAIDRTLPEMAASCEVVDLGGARVIPGLLDAHVHVTGGGGESGPSSRVPRVELGALARAGITTAIGVLGTDGTTRTVRRSWPRRSRCVRRACRRGAGRAAMKCRRSRSPDRCAPTSRFIDPVIGVGEVAISDHRSSQPTFDDIARLAADCHVAGLMSGKAGVLHLHLGTARAASSSYGARSTRRSSPHAYLPDAREPEAASFRRKRSTSPAADARST